MSSSSRSPVVGDDITAGEAFGVVESFIAVSDFYSPVSGKVVAVNENPSSTIPNS